MTTTPTASPGRFRLTRALPPLAPAWNDAPRHGASGGRECTRRKTRSVWRGDALTTMEVSSLEMPRPSPSAAEAPSPETPDPTGGALPERYEDALGELERLVAAMEGGQLPLDTLLASHQRGAALLEHCRQRLQAVEQQVKVLEDGQLKPWASTS